MVLEYCILNMLLYFKSCEMTNTKIDKCSHKIIRYYQISKFIQLAVVKSKKHILYSNMPTMSANTKTDMFSHKSKTK